MIEPGKVVAVYDFGGGTFDAALVRRTASGGFEIVGQPEGIDRLGGIDIDQLLVEHVLDASGAAAVLEGRSVREGVRALAVPGSHRVKAQAEAEGLDKVFTAAGFEWREPGCSMCLAMNPDKLAVGERCASTSNRNFEGRQGRGGRTHLVSPAVAAATAVAGAFATPEDLR